MTFPCFWWVEGANDLAEKSTITPIKQTKQNQIVLCIIKIGLVLKFGASLWTKMSMSKRYLVSNIVVSF